MSHFEQIIKECEDIKIELHKVAEAKKISAKDVDFTLLDVFTYIKAKKEDSFIEATPEIISRFRDDDFILDPNVEIKQRYTIKVFPKSSAKREFEVRILSDEDSFKVLAKVEIKGGKKDEILLHQVYGEIKRKKAFFGLLVGILEDGLKERLRDAFSEPGRVFELPVCTTKSGKKSIDSSFTYEFRGSENIGQNCIVAIRAGEKIATFIKKQKGIEGRNCKGEFVAPKEPEGPDSPPLSPKEGISVKEEEGKTLFVAEKNGYIIIDSSTISVSDKLDIGSLNLAQTGSIIAGIDSGTTLKVGQVEGEDAIGDGITVEVENLEVIGNVGKATKIKAKTVKIEGMTHASSTIEADEISIKTHRGFVRAKKINIQNIEGGIVESEDCVVSKISGGSINSKNIKVYEVYSNAQLSASKLIEIDAMRGEDNKFTIDPRAYFIDREEIDAITKERENILTTLRINSKKLKDKSSFIKQTMTMAKELKNELEDIKTKGGSIPKVLKEKMLEYGTFLRNAKELNSSVKRDSERVKDIEKILHSFDKNTNQAVIINRGSWIGHNEVRFVLLGEDNLFLVPRGEEKVLRIYEDIDGSKSIKGSKD